MSSLKMPNNRNYVFGDQNVQVPAHLNFGSYLLHQMKQFFDKIALENGETGEKMTYKEVANFAVNLANHLINIGVRPGDTVAVAAEKRIEFVPAEIGVLLAGATYTPYSHEVGKAVLKNNLFIVKPQYMICSKLFWELYEDELKSCNTIKKYISFDYNFANSISIKLRDSIKLEIDGFEPPVVQGQTDVACILYSSGTTGMPKGVQLTHLNCILASLPDSFSDETLQTALNYGEWYHNYDTFMTFKFMSCGRKTLFLNDCSHEKLLETIEKFQVNIALLIPSAISYLSKAEDLDKYNLESLKVLYSRSSPLHAKSIERIKEKYPKLKSILQGYGMTEAGELTSECWGTKGPRCGSVGMATPGITLKISDIATGKTLGANQQGEIRLRGPVFMKGYISVDPSTYLDEEGFFKTGDLGFYDEDKYIHIIDRIKEIICYDGYKVAPLELETLLLLHPGVKEVGVVGKPADDVVELPTAFVVKQPGYQVTEQDLVDYVAMEVSPYMQLRGGVIFIEKMPRNPRGKILKRQLKEILNKQT